jgi:predicted secreted protein
MPIGSIIPDLLRGLVDRCSSRRLALWHADAEEEGEVILGTSPSAPANPHLVRTAIITTIVAGIVTFLIWVLFGHYGIGVKEIADWLEGRGPLKARPFGLAHRVPRLNPSCGVLGFQLAG